MSQQSKQRPRQPQKPPSSSKSPPTAVTLLDQTNAVGRAVQATRTDVQRLQPLLELLDETPSDGPSPINELKDLLEAVLLNQRHLTIAVEDLQTRIDAIGSVTVPRSPLFAASRTRA
jgi:hypothetical protein